MAVYDAEYAEFSPKSENSLILDNLYVEFEICRDVVNEQQSTIRVFSRLSRNESSNNQQWGMLQSVDSFASETPKGSQRRCGLLAPNEQDPVLADQVYLLTSVG
jgi:hypothetical protein